MKLFPSLSDDLARWVEQQPVFFTGSAATHGPHVNVSPKGLDAHFAVLGPNQCAYIDRTGSGCETISHAYENGRLCLMFMSFGPSPRIVRLFCRVTVVEWDQPAFPALVRKIAKGKREAFDAARAVILCDIWQAQTSCGFGVPRVKKGLYNPDDDQDGTGSPGVVKAVEDVLREGFRDGEKLTELSVFEQRPNLDNYAATQTQNNKTISYQVTNNCSSLDGLPGLRAARREAGQKLWVGDLKARIRRIASEGEAVAVGFLLAVVLYFVFVWIDVRGISPVRL
ncbi:pyridoxamine phosphate oxidase family [Trichoderma arundinaceum]|uniref:Pyridoxamine phosphate oxidase family n=1 Tax=Trichoderma arundinaceum TaxID=490622 RepID=A0A395NNS4_TRIAR|nr:pyridoxamine phosphate oxidase family [Trichoderma arundinaceum]